MGGVLCSCKFLGEGRSERHSSAPPIKTRLSPNETRRQLRIRILVFSRQQFRRRGFRTRGSPERTVNHAVQFLCSTSHGLI
jgi:hypothetical protein